MARNRSLEIGELTDTAYYILLSLIQAKHGYIVMKTVETITNGKISIGPASLYSTIQKLQSASLIELMDIEDKNKKTYQTTLKGIKLLKKEMLRRQEMVKHAVEILNKKEVLQ